MKYIRTAIIGMMGVMFLYSCDTKEPVFGPGSGEVNFGETSITVAENSDLFSIPLELTGEPGGYPVTVQISTSGVDDIDNVLFISSTTIKITEENNSIVQMVPKYNSDIEDDYTVTLTIESVNGANIGPNNTCTVSITNVPTVQYGQYEFTTSDGSPNMWNLILREGSNGTYILDNMFDLADSPKLVGEFNPETMELSFDGRLNGRGSTSYNQQIGWGYRGVDYLYFQFASPMIFKVDENMQLASVNNAQFSFWLLVLNADQSAIAEEITLASFNNGVCQYAGPVDDTPWPFE